MAQMTPQQRDAFLAEPRIATLVTLTGDGGPTAVPVWFEWDGRIVRVFTSGTSAKVARIEADPRVALMVAEPVGVPEAWVTIEGTARIIEGAMPLIERLTPRYYAPAKAADALDAWRRQADQWVTIEITPTLIRSMAPEPGS